MNCASCGTANPPGHRFCGGCGQSLAARCPACGSEAPPGMKFCGACGASLAAAPAVPAPATPTGARKVVTIVFADLAGSTALHERLDAESVRRFMDAYYQAMRSAVEAHGGTVTQLLGDGVKAVFGAPRVAEDDAIRAVRAAVAMQRAFAELAEAQAGAVGRTGLRVAVNTGEVVASEAAEIIGDPVNVAARLQEQARDGDVVIGEATRRLVSELVTLAPLGTFALKGRSESVAAYRVVSLDRPAGASATPFVGREAELRQILAVYDGAVTDRRARLAVVLGSPGLGKSRVLGEVARRLGDTATVLTAHCDAAGGATFAPIAEALRACLRIEEGASGDAVLEALDAVMQGGRRPTRSEPQASEGGPLQRLGEEADGSRIASGVAAVLAGAPASPEETFFAVRRFLGALARFQPVVLVIDDLQWAEPLLLDLAEHLVQWTTEVPLLVLVAARPELREARSSLAVPGGLVSEVVTLAGLDALAAMKLAANAIGAEALPAAVAGRVLATSEGNPLFIGELVRMLVQDGVLKREGDRWVAGEELAGLEMPPTIQALLAARIERLRPEERTVLERAAVVGRQFSRAAVKELLPREIADFDRLLESLRRSELVEPDPGWFLGEPALRFHHVLIRDAAYRRLLKNTRAELHERFANWVETRVGEAAAHDETLGWHLEQAHRHLRELGPLDAHGVALGERAARVLAEAGRRALARDDVPVAASLLGRALTALDAQDPARAELALDWCESLLAAGEVGEAAAAIDELGRFTEGSPRLAAWHTCFAGERAALTDPQALRATVDAVAAAAEVLASAGDAAGEAKAHFVHAIALSRLGRVGACEAALDRALAAARRGRDHRRSNAVLSGAPQAALWGPSPVTRASGRCLDVVRVLRITRGSSAVEAIALRCQGVLEALRGRSDAARRMIATSRRMVEELGITQRLLEAEMFAGQIELYEGDAAAAEARLRPAYEGLREHGLGIDAARAAALLARALLAQDRAAEAEALSHESEALAGDDLSAAVAWRGVRAEALAQRGEHAAAIEFARAAVEIAAATDALLYHADARTALAAALRAAGRSAEAAAEEGRAVELWEAKGATLLVERARAHVIGREEPKAPEADPAFRGSTAPRPVRRIQPNRATRYAERIAAAFAARDLDAISELTAEDSQLVEHLTRDTLDREGALRSYRMLLAVDEPGWRTEPLAALGDSLALFRWSRSGRGVADFGPFAMEDLILTEVDARGRHLCGETFAIDHLGDAVARLYERHAELLPAGPERDRAEVIARSVATVIAPLDPDRWIASLAPDVEWTSQGPVAYPPGRGMQGMVRALRSFADLGTVTTNRVEEVCARPDVLLLRFSASGTDGEGGPWERLSIIVFRFAPDGRIARLDMFEPERAADALARFDALTAEPVRPARRVRPNAATERVERLARAMNARDAAALERFFPADTETVDRPTGRVMDRREDIASLRGLLDNRDLRFEVEPIAALGDTLALTRIRVSASGAPRLDVGSYAVEAYLLDEVEPGRHRGERFDCDHLSDAIVRLYERYAELLPAGPERERAAATARSLAALMVPLDPDRWATAISPSVEWAGQGPVTYPAGRGAETMLRAIRSFLDVGSITTDRVDDVLALAPNALLRLGTSAGTDHREGGTWERTQIYLFVFGEDGLLARLEYFEPDHAADALTRFDALTAEPSSAKRRVRPNAATENVARAESAIESRDLDGFAAQLADDFEAINHPNHLTHDRAAMVATMRIFLAAEGRSNRHELLATIGDSLALCRFRLAAEGSGGSLDAGAYEVEFLSVIEVDAHGRRNRSETFRIDQLGDAVVCLYERHAERLPAGPERDRAAATARSVARLREYPDRWLFASDVEVVDHRIVGLEPVHGREAVLGTIRALANLVEDSSASWDDVLALRPDALITIRTHSGIDRASGGAFERPICSLVLFGADGLVTRWERFEPDRAADALARFDELTAVPLRPARRVRPNLASAYSARLAAAISARDSAAFPMLVAEDSEVIEHTTGAVYDRAAQIATIRVLLESRDLVYEQSALATLGDFLVLSHISLSASGASGRRFDVGPYAADQLTVTEADEDGRCCRTELFAADHLGDAIVRLYERYAELLPAGAERDRAAAIARSVAALSEYPDRWAFASDVEVIDHRSVGIEPTRGREAVLATIHALAELVEGSTTRWDDVLAVRPDGLLALRTHSGIDRTTGGAFERHLCSLILFGNDGLVTRWERFEPERAADALARFDALTAEPPRPARRVRPNAATAHAARRDAAFAARDVQATKDLLSETSRVVDYMTGVTYDREGELATFELVWQSRNPSHGSEPLATLGDALALCRIAVSGSARDESAAGAWEVDRIGVIEVGPDGRRERFEVFADDRLGDAIVRLYERYAELLPAGPQHERAAATACSIAALMESSEHDRWAAAISPEIHLVDHRLLGFGSSRGAARYLAGLRALYEDAENVAMPVEDVLAACPDALLVVRTVTGTGRLGGGAFDRQFLQLWTFDADGLGAQQELFDPDRAADALARFDDLTAEPARPARRVRPNAATANAARVDALVAARDVEAFPSLVTDDIQVVHHLTGIVYGGEAVLHTLREVSAQPGLAYRHDPLATLGDSLALFRFSMSATRATMPGFDVGAFDVEHVVLADVDARGRRRWVEMFAADRLGDAVVRLYERHADLLPEGPERTRATAIARSFASLSGRISVARYTSALAPEFELDDHRILGTSAASRADEAVRDMRSWLELTDDLVMHDDEILDLRADAILVQRRSSGIARDGGGAFERAFLVLIVFGVDGLVSRIDLFDSDREDDGLARFDALTAEPSRPARRVRPNAATEHVTRVDAAIASRDLASIAALWAERAETIDHPNGASYDREGVLATLRSLFKARDLRHRHEHLATLGDSLVLSRLVLSASAFTGASFDVGPYEREQFTLVAIDREGRSTRTEIFASDHLGDVVARLYELYAESLPAGPERERAAAIARSIPALMSPRPEELGATFAREYEFADHRALIQLPSGRGADEMRRLAALWFEGVEDYAQFPIDVLDLRPEGLLTRMRERGRDRTTGGTFENEFIALNRFDDDGRLAQNEMFDADRESDALARFDQLTAKPTRPDPLRIPPNAASAAFDRVEAARETLDWEAMRALCSPQMVYDERRRLVRTTGDRDMFVDNAKLIAKAGSRLSRTRLATSGDRLALERFLYTGSRDGGPFEIEALCIIEVDAAGSIVAIVSPEDRRAASREMLERTARSAPPWMPQAGFELERAIADHDLARCRAAVPDDFVFDDHRFPGAGRLESTDAFVAFMAAAFEQSSDVIVEMLYTVAREEHGELAVVRMYGTLADGGEFETVSVRLARLEDGRLVGVELFELDDLDRARARFEELRPDPLHIPPNAASRALERIAAADDPAPVARALASDDFAFEDRGKRALLSGGGAEQWIASAEFYRSRGGQLTLELIGTRGDRIAIERAVWAGESAESAWEIEFAVLIETDAVGRIRAVIRFDADDRAAAFEEADARFHAGEAAGIAGQAAIAALFHRSADREWTTFRNRLADDAVICDRRTPSVLGTLDRDAWVQSVRTLADLAPDLAGEIVRILSWNEFGRVQVARQFGTRDGGPWESPFVGLFMISGDRVQRYEIYDLDAADAALARFAELCAERDPLWIPPNAASRAIERIVALDGDRAAQRPLLSDDFVFDDRGKRALTSGGAELWVQTVAFYRSEGGRATRERIATRGDRIELVRITWSGPPGANEWELERIVLHEVDAEGRLRAVIRFDAEDRDAAFEEAEVRFLAGEAAEVGGQSPFLDLRMALRRRDWEAMRRCFTADAVIRDHRTLSVGQENVDEFIASRRAQAELSPDSHTEPPRLLAWNRHGRVMVLREVGSALHGGGPFERVHVSVWLTDGDRVDHWEAFDVDAADAALARFAELCAERE